MTAPKRKSAVERFIEGLTNDNIQKMDAVRAVKIREFHEIAMICTNFACPCLTFEQKLELIVSKPQP